MSCECNGGPLTCPIMKPCLPRTTHSCRGCVRQVAKSIHRSLLSYLAMLGRTITVLKLGSALCMPRSNSIPITCLPQDRVYFSGRHEPRSLTALAPNYRDG